MKTFRLLNADEIECRVSRITEKGLSLLLYKTARTDADLLDEKFGADKWENDFKLVDGVLYGGIGVDYGKGLVWKWDAGTESNTEAEKGRASDAFKRAGFKHGIGRELYTAPFIWIGKDDCKITEKNGRMVCNDNFSVKAIEYDDAQHIAGLEIVNEKSNRTVYRFGTIADKWGMAMLDCVAAHGDEPKEAPKESLRFTCDVCGEPIIDTTFGGKTYGLREWCEGTQKRFGKQLCKKCRSALVKKDADK